MCSKIAIGFHLVYLTIVSYTLWSDATYYHVNTNGFFEYNGFGGKFKYLTHLCMLTQFAYDVVSLLLLCTKKSGFYRENSGLYKFVSFFAAAVHAPLCMYVSLAFWGIRLLKGVESMNVDSTSPVPFWMVHVAHTLPVVSVFLERLVVFHKYPPRIFSLTFSFSIGVAYNIWLFYLGLVHHIWVYPFIERLGVKGTLVFGIFSSLSAIVFNLIGEFTTYLIWRRTIHFKNK